MQNSIFLQKLQKAWELYKPSSFCEFMNEVAYIAEGHTEILFSSEAKLEEVFDKIIATGGRITL